MDEPRLLPLPDEFTYDAADAVWGGSPVTFKYAFAAGQVIRFCTCGHSETQHYCLIGHCFVGEVNEPDGRRPFVGEDRCSQFTQA